MKEILILTLTILIRILASIINALIGSILVQYIYYIAEIIDINPFFIIIAFLIIGPATISTIKKY